MGNRTTRDQRPLVTLTIIGVVIVAIVTGVYFYLDWQRSRPATPVQELTVTATAGDTEVSTPPYSVCEFGEECPENDIALFHVDTSSGADEAPESMRITVPKDVAELQWSVLSIYDDPAANTERTFTPGEATEVDVPLTTPGDETHLVVVEVSCLMLDVDDAGEETPVVVTWAFSTESR